MAQASLIMASKLMIVILTNLQLLKSLSWFQLQKIMKNWSKMKIYQKLLNNIKTIKSKDINKKKIQLKIN